jgi:hypothetical protein
MDRTDAVDEQDPVLEALTNLADMATSTADDLAVLNEDLAHIRRSRQQGSSWRHIISDAAFANPLSIVTKVAADLALACAGFRRALAIGLRREGLQVTEIAGLFDVSRQRVSALLRTHGTNRSADSTRAGGSSPPR